MKISYPLLNITLDRWNSEIVQEIFWYDDYYYSNDDTFFQEYFLNHEFVDCNGKIFRAIAKTPIKNFWKFFPGSKKSRVQFQDTGRKLTFEELKGLMIERVKSLIGWTEDVKIPWISRLERASSIKELIDG